MENVVVFQSTMPEIGLIARKPTEGPEAVLVRHFVRCLIDDWKSRCHASIGLAVFVEPLIDTGYPDIVLAEYRRSFLDSWISERALLQTGDLKVCHHIVNRGLVDEEGMQVQLGIEKNVLRARLERLTNAGLVRRTRSGWKGKPIKRILGLRRLVAVEAKIQNWSIAFEQASLNRWFSSESYVLTPVAEPAAVVRERCASIGIGLYVRRETGFERIQVSGVTTIPSSHVSWLFNEWIGRASMMGGVSNGARSGSANKSDRGRF